MTKQTDELAALKKKVEELEAKLSPPKPFVSKPHEPIDWTARMSMPPSVVREMANAVPDYHLRSIALRDARAPTGPSSAGAIPSSQQVSNVRGAGGTPGWVEPRPLSNPPGINYVDAICVADDARQQAELKRKMGGG